MIKIQTNTGKVFIISPQDFPIKILDVNTLEGLKNYSVDMFRSGKIQMTIDKPFEKSI